MSAFEKFGYQSLEEIQEAIDKLGLVIPSSDDFGVLGQPIQIGHRTAPNRLVVHPMEGCDSNPDGSPTELVLRRYRRFGAGGAGLLWFEACAILQEGRANPLQMMLTKGNLDEFKRLVEETRKAARESMGADHDPVCLLQLTHSGRYSRPFDRPRPIIAHHSAVLDPKHNLQPDYPLITDEEIDRLPDLYVRSAKLARDAGFDGVDVKACHRYLISELLASFTREDSRYGGEEFENRTRLVREVHKRIAEEVPGIIVSSRMNSFDGIPYPYGWGVDKDDCLKPDLSEPKRLAGILKEQGAPCLSVTVGNPYYIPHINRPFDEPISGMPLPDEHPLAGASRFIHIVKEIQQAHPDLPIIGAGYTYFRQFVPWFAAGAVKNGWASMVGLGRAAFAYPDFAKDILNEGRMERLKTCITCSACTQIMRDHGTSGCVIRDSEVYGPIYREGRRRAPDTIQAEAERCRHCAAPTCTAGCPASVDVPGFVRAAAEGDFRKAYDILRANNPLPELCGYICPVEVQCEGACIETSLNGRPVPIRDIQRFVANEARLNGWAKVRIPEQKSDIRVAVIGAGPGGLGCAAQLLEAGHSVTMFEATDVAGGIARQTIPSHRLSNDDVQAELEALLEDVPADRLEWRFKTALGRDISLDGLSKEYGYDAVFLGLGLMESVPLSPAQERPQGVKSALEFLMEMKSDAKATVPRTVAVLGGGNTAMDAAVVAKRHGAADVYVVYRRSFSEMPAWPEERDVAVAMGVHFLILTQPTVYEADSNGVLTGLRTARTVLGDPDASGRRRPRIVPDSEASLEVELVIEALGQKASADAQRILPGIEFTKYGLIHVEPDTMKTSRGNIYAGGDIVNGGATAVQAVAEGVLAARAIDAAVTCKG
jgi:2,4-dienoyl-CoA reductase (NADPH2)